MSDRQEAAYRVLDQLQRSFCFLKLSKRRFFDPVQFVKACRSLNLNFNVYHQNDAAEFADQLLDRIETATKDKHTPSKTRGTTPSCRLSVTLINYNCTCDCEITLDDDNYCQVLFR